MMDQFWHKSTWKLDVYSPLVDHKTPLRLVVLHTFQILFYLLLIVLPLLTHIGFNSFFYDSFLSCSIHPYFWTLYAFLLLLCSFVLIGHNYPRKRSKIIHLVLDILYGLMPPSFVGPQSHSSYFLGFSCPLVSLLCGGH